MSDIKRKASLKKKKSPFFQTNWVLSSWHEYRVTFIVGEDGNGKGRLLLLWGRTEMGRVGGRDRGGVGTTKAAAIAVIRHGGGAR